MGCMVPCLAGGLASQSTYLDSNESESECPRMSSPSDDDYKTDNKRVCSSFCLRNTLSALSFEYTKLNFYSVSCMALNATYVPRFLIMYHLLTKKRELFKSKFLASCICNLFLFTVEGCSVAGPWMISNAMFA